MHTNWHIKNNYVMCKGLKIWHIQRWKSGKREMDTLIDKVMVIWTSFTLDTENNQWKEAQFSLWEM